MNYRYTLLIVAVIVFISLFSFSFAQDHDSSSSGNRPTFGNNPFVEPQKSHSDNAIHQYLDNNDSEDVAQNENWKKLEDLVIEIRPQEDVLHPILGLFVLAVFVYLLIFIALSGIGIVGHIRRRKIQKSERPQKRLWFKLIFIGATIISIAFLWVVYDEWSFYEVFPAPYIYSEDQQQLIEHYGLPDSFSIFFGSDEEGYDSRFETWYYYEYEQSFVFKNGVFLTYDDVEPLEANYVTSPYEPSEFTPYMNSRFIWRWLGVRLDGDVEFPNPMLDLKETLPELFEGYELRLIYYTQLAVGFDDEIDRLIYVNTQIMTEQLEAESEDEEELDISTAEGE